MEPQGEKHVWDEECLEALAYMHTNWMPSGTTKTEVLGNPEQWFPDSLLPSRMGAIKELNTNFCPTASGYFPSAEGCGWHRSVGWHGHQCLLTQPIALQDPLTLASQLRTKAWGPPTSRAPGPTWATPGWVREASRCSHHFLSAREVIPRSPGGEGSNMA